MNDDLNDVCITQPEHKVKQAKNLFIPKTHPAQYIQLRRSRDN